MPAPGVAASDYNSFVSVMHLRVHEEAPLWELPLKSATVLPDGATHRGPWAVESCTWVMLRWLESGLVGVYRSKPGSEAIDLSSEDARAAIVCIDEPARNGGSLFIDATDVGKGSPFELWRTRAE